VPVVSLPELETFASALTPEGFDDESKRSLGRAYEEFATRRRSTIAPFSLTIDGRPFPSLYAGLVDRSTRFDSGEIAIAGPVSSRPGWEFLVPFGRIALAEDGSAEVSSPGGGTPRRAIARVLLREHHLLRGRSSVAPVGDPRVGGSESPRTIGTVSQGFAICRAVPVLPFSVAILLYLAEERVRYELDLVHGTVLADARAGRLSAARRVPRSSRVAWGVDRHVGLGHLSLLSARCLEVIVESNGLTSVELAHIFGGVRGLVDAALRGLVDQKVAAFDPRTGLYHPRLEAFLPAAEGSAAPAVAAPASPELRSSVRELQAAADARASCPLCGRPLTPGSTWILCDACAKDVGVA
jgi:hypothetical protein